MTPLPGGPAEEISAMTADELADRLPLVASNVMVALERHDLLGAGLQNVRQLALICSRAEAFFVTWRHERAATKTR